MFKPYFTYVEAPGRGGRVVEQNSLYIKSEIQLISKWGGDILNPYRDLQFGGTELGFKGHNYWFSDNSFLGKILKFLVI